VQLTFSNTAIAMEYYTRRNSANGAATQALKVLRAEKVSQGLATPSEWNIILVDENGNETTLT
jgi:hypothetical protein